MLKTLRIICSIIAALCVAAVPFVGIYAGLYYVIFLGIGILVFFMLTLLLKHLQDEKESKQPNADEKDKSDDEKKDK